MKYSIHIRIAFIFVVVLLSRIMTESKSISNDLEDKSANSDVESKAANNWNNGQAVKAGATYVKKPGSCPPLQMSKPKFKCKGFTMACVTDTYCPDNTKCCFHFCGFFCQQPVSNSSTQITHVIN